MGDIARGARESYHRIKRPDEGGDSVRYNALIMERSGTRREALVVMAKAPVVGTVKTRLHGALGAERATELYRCMLRDTISTVQQVCDERASVEPVLCYSPAADLAAFSGIVGHWRAIPQRGDDLGERLANCLRDLFDARMDATAIIGADSPTLPARHVLAAFDALDDGANVVLGPTRDGGYYLFASDGPHVGMFERVPWSTEAVFDVSCARAKALDLHLSVIETWYDVDEPSDLAGLIRDAAPTSSCRQFLDDVSRPSQG